MCLQKKLIQTYDLQLHHSQSYQYRKLINTFLLSGRDLELDRTLVNAMIDVALSC